MNAVSWWGSTVDLASESWLVSTYFKSSQNSVVTDLVKQVFNAGGPFKDSCKTSFFLLEHTVLSVFEADTLQLRKTCLTSMCCDVKSESNWRRSELLPLGLQTQRDSQCYQIYLHLLLPPPGAEHVKHECLFSCMHIYFNQLNPTCTFAAAVPSVGFCGFLNMLLKIFFSWWKRKCC